MKFYDVYNGDADGLCALLQLRLSTPRETILVSGTKRDIALLDRIDGQSGDEIVVLDISLDANRDALDRALQRGARVSWFDHHYPGRIPAHPAFVSHIDTDPGMCTSLIVDRYLGGQFRLWAVVAAFGDNLEQPAGQLAAAVGLDRAETDLLREFGMCLNYNAYGDNIDELLFSPVDLFGQMKPFKDPREFIRASTVFDALQWRLRDDLARADSIRVQPIAPGSAYAVLPDADWSRRVVGVYANRLAQEDPHTAHAVLVTKRDGYMTSIRAPAANPKGASRVARSFDSGGGREGAAGVDFLPSSQVERLLEVMRATFIPEG